MPRFMKTKSSPPARSGRFTGGPAAEVAAFTESVSFDWRLWKHDLLGSMVHATMLSKIGVLTAAEHRAIVAGLDAISGEDMRAGRFAWGGWILEDVHMTFEGRALRTACPPREALTLAAGTTRWPWTSAFGCATTWPRTALGRRRPHRRALGPAMPAWARPGYMHLQRAQPASSRTTCWPTSRCSTAIAPASLTPLSG